MNKKYKLLLFFFILISALTLTGCNEKPSNYTIVRYDNGSVSYENYGKETNEDTVYELGSNGKTVAAYTALAMVDEGILDLDEKIYPYLDSELTTNDERIKDITLRELLCHTAGFSPSYELGVDKKIYSNPGEKFRYSGVGYIYLQNVIENASNMSMDEASAKYVFEPLGMKNSTFESTKTVTPYLNLSNAVLYALVVFTIVFILLSVIALIIGLISKFKLYKYKFAFPVCFALAGIINSVVLLIVLSNLSKVYFIFLICFVVMGTILFVTRKKPVLYYLVAPLFLILILVLGFVIPVTVPVTNDLVHDKANVAYSFKSTGKDMTLFCNALCEKLNEDEGAFGEMFDSNVDIDEKNAWGLGVAIEYTEENEPMYWHSGINPGFQSLYVLYPKENKYIVVLTNSDRGLDYSKERAIEYLGVNGIWEIKR